jgi:hypothetical protein
MGGIPIEVIPSGLSWSNYYAKNLGHKTPYGIDFPSFSEKSMAETALVVQSNLSHNVPAAIEAAKNRLTDLASLYLVTEVAGQSQAILDAKRRDLRV